MYHHVVAGLTIALARLRLNDNDGFSKLSTALVSFRLNYDEVDPECLPDGDIVESTAALASFRLDTADADPELAPEVDTAESIAAQDRLPLDTDESESGLSTSILSEDSSDASGYSQLVSDGPNPVIVNKMLLFPSKSSAWEEAMTLTLLLEGEILLEVVVAGSSLSPLRPEQHNNKHEAEPFTIPTPDIHIQANKHSQLASDGSDSVSQSFLSLVYLPAYDKELEEVLAAISIPEIDTQVNKHLQLVFDAPNSVTESPLSPVCPRLDSDELLAELLSILESDIDTQSNKYPQLISNASCAVVINNMPSSTTTTSGHGTPKETIAEVGFLPSRSSHSDAINGHSFNQSNLKSPVLVSTNIPTVQSLSFESHRLLPFMASIKSRTAPAKPFSRGILKSTSGTFNRSKSLFLNNHKAESKSIKSILSENAFLLSPSKLRRLEATMKNIILIR